MERGPSRDQGPKPQRTLGSRQEHPPTNYSYFPISCNFTTEQGNVPRKPASHERTQAASLPNGLFYLSITRFGNDFYHQLYIFTQSQCSGLVLLGLVLFCSVLFDTHPPM